MAKAHPRSPLAPKKPAVLKPVRGAVLASLETGLRYKGREDLLLVALAEGTSVAGVFTRSTAAAAPVLWCRKALKGGYARGLLVNAGHANAATGKTGQALVAGSVSAVAAALRCKKEEVFIASTGIIGRPLPAQAHADFVPALAAQLKGKASAARWARAAKAIMTTDTFPKGASRTVQLGGKRVTITGFAKGSGMIAPNMATLLGFVFTDAAIAPRALQALLAHGADKSFNSITVDGDTSTNDTLLAFATGAAGNRPVQRADESAARAFAAALDDVLVELAQLIVRDGEGAQKFVTIDVRGATSDAAARRHALTIANSPLVKTAIAGADANWGRILGAAGRSGEKMNMDRVQVKIGGFLICRQGQQIRNYDEAPVARHMRGRDIHIELDVGVKKKGGGQARVYTCDLTHGYISINGDYRS